MVPMRVSSLVRPIPAVINHLLEQEPAARRLLTRYRGRTVRFDTGAFQLCLRVTQDDLFESVPDDADVNVTLQCKLSDLPLIAANQERAISYVKIEGDADFANTLAQISRTVHWDAEDDISKWVGDIAAVRAVSGVKTALATVKAVHTSLLDNLVEYFRDERAMLLHPQKVREFSAEVVQLRDSIERITKRIDKLERH